MHSPMRHLCCTYTLLISHLLICVEVEVVTGLLRSFELVLTEK